jgi:predicted PurR-regulated permease PerM
MQATGKGGADVAPQVQVKVPTVTVVTDDGKSEVLQIPTSHDEMMALIAQRDALNDQLEQATDRRNDLIEQLQSAPSEAHAGLQVQLNELSGQIVQIQRDLNRVGREISQASPALIAMAKENHDTPDMNGSFDDGVFAGIAGTIAVLIVLMFLGRKRWRKVARRYQPLMPAADSERLQRLEQGIEAMAIEIERISEGQRFVTKLLAESRGVESAPR